jgi:hypothetical protein
VFASLLGVAHKPTPLPVPGPCPRGPDLSLPGIISKNLELLINVCDANIVIKVNICSFE